MLWNANLIGMDNGLKGLFSSCIALRLYFTSFAIQWFGIPSMFQTFSIKIMKTIVMPAWLIKHNFTLWINYKLIFFILSFDVYSNGYFTNIVPCHYQKQNLAVSLSLPYFTFNDPSSIKLQPLIAIIRI